MPGKLSMGPVGFFGLSLGFIASIAGAYAIGQKTKTIKDPMEVYVKEFQAYKDSVVIPTLIYADSLRNEATELKNSATAAQRIATIKTTELKKLEIVVSTLRKQNKLLSDSVLSDNALPPECDQCVRAVSSLKTEVDSLSKIVGLQESRDTSRVKTIELLNTSLDLSLIRGDSLQHIITSFPQPKQNKFLGIKFPRVPSQYVLLGGAVLGILLVR